MTRAALLVPLVLSVALGAQDRPVTPAARFENIAAAAGLDFRHVQGGDPDRPLHEIMGSGGLFLDVDNDGRIDVFLVDGGSLTDAAVARRARHRLYRNRGNGTFEDITARSGLTHSQYGMGACAADIDNDGWTDLYVTTVGTNRLFRNTGRGVFTDITPTAGVAGAALFSASCAFGDIDSDGFVDLYVANYVDARVDNNVFCGDAAKRLRVYCHPLNFAPLVDALFRNNGDGTFTDISVSSGIGAFRGNGLGVVFSDYNDDGRPDVFVANDAVPNFLFRNDGRGVLTEVALLAGVAVANDGRARAGMGTDFGDYDADGLLDLFVTNHELETHTLFRNLGGGLFRDVTVATGLAVPTLPYVGFGTLFFDYDSDGHLDIATVNGHVMNSPEAFRAGATLAQRRLLLRNGEGRRFTEIGRQAGTGFTAQTVGRTLAAGDIDNDGTLELLVTSNDGAVELLRNAMPHGNNGLLVRLAGTRSNRNAIGARLRLTAGGRTYVRDVKAGSGYLGQHDLRVHVGLGRAARVDRLEVLWPAGTTDVVSGLAVNQIVTIVEGTGVTERTPFARR